MNNNIKIATIEKYTKVLRILVEDITNKKFKSKMFTHTHKVHTDFLMAAFEEGYFYKKGKGPNIIYWTDKKLIDIHPMDGKKIAVWMANKAKERREAKEQITQSELSEFSDEELYEELKSRGYEGKMEKKLTLE